MDSYFKVSSPFTSDKSCLLLSLKHTAELTSTCQQEVKSSNQYVISKMIPQSLLDFLENYCYKSVTTQITHNTHALVKKFLPKQISNQSCFLFLEFKAVSFQLQDHRVGFTGPHMCTCAHTRTHRCSPPSRINGTSASGG